MALTVLAQSGRPPSRAMSTAHLFYLCHHSRASSDFDPALLLTLRLHPCRSSSHLCSSITIMAMQFNAEPAVQDPRFAPNTATNNSSTQPPDDDPSAMSATREHVDIDRQCAVPQYNGVPCPASLACQSHTIQDKYGVPGRTAPLEHLIARQQQEMAQLPQQ